MGAMGILLPFALMGITAIILMHARRMGTTDLRGSLAACSLGQGPGITAAIMAIAADTMAGRFTATAARAMAMATATEVECPTVVDTAAGPPFEADSPEAAITGMPAAASMVVAVVGSTVAVDTGNSVQCG